MFAYPPLMLVNVDGTAIEKQPKRIVIFKGEGNVFKHEKPLYHPDVSVYFQPRGVVDEDLMSLIYAEWEGFLGDVFGDAAKPHRTPNAKCNVFDNTLCASLKTSTTTVGQYLDTDFNLVIKDVFANTFATEVERCQQQTDGCW